MLRQDNKISMARGFAVALASILLVTCGTAAPEQQQETSGKEDLWDVGTFTICLADGVEDLFGGEPALDSLLSCGLLGLYTDQFASEAGLTASQSDCFLKEMFALPKIRQSYSNAFSGGIDDPFDDPALQENLVQIATKCKIDPAKLDIILE